MNLRNLFSHLWRRTVNSKETADQPQSAVMKTMLIGLARTQAQEFSCDEVYALLDVFADRVGQGEDAASLMPFVQHHLEMCPDCREELLALLKSIQATATNGNAA